MANQMHYRRIRQVRDYEQFVGGETVERIEEKARRLGDLYVTNINVTCYGGGVAH